MGEITEDSVSNCCGQVLRGFLTVHRVLLLRFLPAVPDRLRLSQEQLCPFVALPCSAHILGRDFISSQGANPRNKGSRFEGCFFFTPKPAGSGSFSLSFLPAHILTSFHLIGVGLADGVYERSRISFIIVYVYHMYIFSLFYVQRVFLRRRSLGR